MTYSPSYSQTPPHSKKSTFIFFVTCAKNLEGLLREEILEIGNNNVVLKETVAGVYVEGTLELAYRICLWSRLANQVLLKLVEFEVRDSQGLYREIQKIRWSEHLDLDRTFAVDITGEHNFMTHSLYTAQRIKDAIVDQFRKVTGDRPSIETSRPDVLLNLHMDGEFCTLSLSLSGESLHRRGYRLEGGKAPLKETLAAAILIRAGWPKYLKQENPVLLDPMCGTGTLLIEAAFMAFDIAPGLDRTYFGFLGWKHHDGEIWRKLLKEAEDRQSKGLTRKDVKILGSDIHPEAIAKSQENISKAGLASYISVKLGDCTELKYPEELTPPLCPTDQEPVELSLPPGERRDQDTPQKNNRLIICNPPYGERMNPGDFESLDLLFKGFGDALKAHFMGWHMAVFSGAPKECTQHLRMRSHKSYPLYNGTLPCRVYLFEIEKEKFFRD